MTLSREVIDTAVSDPDWQKFRLTLKGVSTEEKLIRLRRLADATIQNHTHVGEGMCSVAYDNYVRILNYLNALSRGGQIMPIPQNRDLVGIRTIMGSMGKCNNCPRYFLSDTNERRCAKCSKI